MAKDKAQQASAWRRNLTPALLILWIAVAAPLALRLYHSKTCAQHAPAVPQNVTQLGATQGLYETDVLSPVDHAASDLACSASNVAADGTDGASEAAAVATDAAEAPRRQRPNADPVVSGLGPALSPEELHGGWQLTQEIYDRAMKHPNATVVSESHPRVVMFPGFISEGEVQHIIKLAEGTFTRSTVVSDEAVNSQRTSEGAWLSGDLRDDVVLSIQARTHELLGIPEAFGESFYVLKYQERQKYLAHQDHCATARGVYETEHCKKFLGRAGGPSCGAGSGGVTCGDRMATFILYLNAPIRGGETVFPKAHLHAAQEGMDVDGIPEYCQQSSPALKVMPPPGTVVLFWDYVPGASDDVALPDDNALHGGCPVLEGTKLIASRWIRSAEFH